MPRRFGFERPIPFDIPISISHLKNPQTPWSPELLVQTAFGQGELQATPMQMALVAASVANGGRVPTPYVVSEVRGSGSTRVPHQPGEFFSVAMSDATARTMTDFMVEGVQNGYAARAAIPACASAARPARPKSATACRTRGSSALRQRTSHALPWP